jgi:uncharacterized YigZ family protein
MSEPPPAAPAERNTSYRVPAARTGAELREKGSRFLAVVGPVAGDEEAGAVRAGLAREHGDATHLCWALRLGWPPRERCSDAGEPAGTAGTPILQVLRGAGLSDVQAVVLRWFGGVKLGRGGLARAYAAAVRAAVEPLATVWRAPRVRLGLTAPAARVGAVKRLLRPPSIELESEAWSGDPAIARIVLLVDEERRAGLEQALADLRIAVTAAAPATAPVAPDGPVTPVTPASL